MGTIEIYLGDITKLRMDAIVNAANKTLLGGGGVDGAIHKAAGPLLLEACRKLNGCETGQAKVTAGFNLPARFIIHTVGPVWSGGGHREESLLRNCYLNSLSIAEELKIKSIAFPAISTGAYRFPVELAARIAVTTIREHMSRSAMIEQVILAAFNEQMKSELENAMKAYISDTDGGTRTPTPFGH